MPTWYPKVNARADGAEQSITRNHYVWFRSGDQSPNVQLQEVPLEGSVSIPGFTEVSTAPGPRQFRVHYAGDLAPGRIDFHFDDEDSVVSVSYMGRGSPIIADDINALQTYKLDNAFTAIANAQGAVQLQANGAGALRLKSGDGIAFRFDSVYNTLFIESVDVWKPTNIPGCVVWLDGEHADIDPSSGDVVRWHDRSGQKHNFLAPDLPGAGNGLSRGVVNGLDAVRFWGAHYMYNDDVTLGGVYSIFAVVSRGDTWNTPPSGWQRLVGSGSHFMLGALDAELGARFGNGATFTSGGSYGPDSSFGAGGFRLVSMVQQGNGDVAYLRGQNVGAHTSSTSGSSTGLVLGGTPDGQEGWEGHLAALIIYNRALHTTERRMVEKYLGEKYGFTVEYNTLSDMEAPAAWFDAGTLGLQDGEPVASWTDRSPAGRNAVQNDDARRPVYHAGVANGKPVVRFDGVDDVLSLAADVNARHVFVVLGNHVPTAAEQAVFGALSADQGIEIVSRTDAVGDPYYTFSFRSGMLVPLQGRTRVPTSGFAILHTSANTSTMGLTLNGVADRTASYGAVHTVGRIGARGTSSSAPLKADVAEVLVFDRDLSVAERKYVEQYLAGKYGITVRHDVPADIPGLLAWFDARSLRQGSVSFWPDQSQRGNQVAQAQANQKPTADGSRVTFGTTGMHLAGNLGDTAAPLTIFVFAKFSQINQPAANHDWVLSLGSAGVGQSGERASISRHANDGANTNKYYSFDGAVNRFGPVLAYNPANDMITVIHDTTAPRHRLRVNGVDATVQDYPAALASNGRLYLGIDPSGTHSFSGELFSVIVYERVLTAAEITAVEQYLTDAFAYM